MKYWVIFLMLTIVYLGIIGCAKKNNDYKLKGFFTVRL
jgi:hypothetical protein